jgi:hypothetical protein
MEHLQVFIEWAQKDYSRLVSAKQRKFFADKLRRAMAAHTLPTNDMSGRFPCIAFFFDAGVDVITSTDYILVEMPTPTAATPYGRLCVNFGEAACQRLGLRWGINGKYVDDKSARPS